MWKLRTRILVIKEELKKIVQLQKDIQNPQNKEQLAELKLLKEQIKIQRKGYRKLQKENRRINKKNEKLEANNVKLEQGLEQANELLENQTTQLQRSIEVFEQTSQLLNDENEQLQKDIQNNEKQHEFEISNLKKEFQNNEKQHEFDITNLKKSINEMKDRNKLLKWEKETHKEDCFLKYKENEQLRKTYSRQTSQKLSNQQEAKEEVSQIELKSEKEIHNFQNTINKLEENNKQLKWQLDTHKDELFQKYKEIRELRVKLSKQSSQKLLNQEKVKEQRNEKDNEKFYTKVEEETNKQKTGEEIYKDELNTSDYNITEKLILIN